MVKLRYDEIVPADTTRPGVSLPVLDTGGEKYHLSNWGAVFDGTTDDSGAIQDAINAVATLGRGILVAPPGIARLASPVAWPNDAAITLQGSGIGQTIFDCDGVAFLTVSATPVASTTASASITGGARTFSVSSASGIAVGLLIAISSTESLPETAQTGLRSHTAIVTGVSGTAITLDRPFPIGMSVSGETVTVEAYESAPSAFRGFSVLSHYSGYVCEMRYMRGMQWSEVLFKGKNETFQGEVNDPTDGDMTAIRTQFCADARFSKMQFEFMQYGVLPGRGANGTVMERSTARMCRHILAPAGGAENTRGLHLDTYGCFAGLDSHGGAFSTYYYDCHTYADTSINKFRGRVDVVENCTFDSPFEFRHDAGLTSLTAAERSKLTKRAVNVKASGDFDLTVSFNVTLEGVEADGRLLNFRSTDTGGKLRIEDSVFTITENPEDATVLENAGLALAFYRDVRIRGLRLYGPYRGTSQSGNSMDATPLAGIWAGRDILSGDPQGASVDIDGLEIDGFDRGIYLPFELDLSRWKIRNVDINNCVNGIDPAANDKSYLTLSRVRFQGCDTDILNPERLLYRQLTRQLTGSRTWDPASIPDGGSLSITVTVPGVVLGEPNPAVASFTSVTNAGWALTARVTADDTVTVTLINNTGGAVDLPSGTLTASVGVY